MDFSQFRSKENAIIIALILIFAIFGLWLRLLPMEQLTTGPYQKIIFMDPWYSLRQIEVIAANFPGYPWFDPMNGFPTGKGIDWGPLYPTFSALIVVLLGASTRNDIMAVASWIPPLLSLTMIPVMYYTGRLVLNKKAGVIAACLISVIAGEYLYRSFYGYLDHHFMEVLLSSLFLLFYLALLRMAGTDNEEIPWNHKGFIICSVLAGLTYYLGMMNIPTIILFAGIAGLFCFIHAIVTRDEKSLKILSFAHTIILGIFILLYSLTGIHAKELTLSQYTAVHILMALGLIAEPVLLYGIIRFSSGKPAWQTRGMMIGIPVLFYLLGSLLLPSVFRKISEGFTSFFFFSYKESFINEMQMWDMSRAWHSFNIALLIMLAGLIITGYLVSRKYDAVRVCALVWGLVVLVSTILHLRYEYYVAVIVVLFSSIALAWLYDRISQYTSRKERNGKPAVKNPGKGTFALYLPFIGVGLIIMIITALSAQITWVVATEQLKMIGMNDDWADALTWLGENSPDPGVDYLKIYPREGFFYPESAYGILAWWDFGHWISYLSKRIPITTPFQNNVPPVARFLVATDEKKADELAEQVGARYIVIDYETISSKYPSLPLWAYGQTARSQYQKYYYQRDEINQNQYTPILILRPDFFTSMVSRLYIFDGSLTNSTGATRIRYSDMKVGDQDIPAITMSTPLKPEEVDTALAQGITPGTDIVSVQYTHPISSIPALTHYRLVYESPSVTAADEYARLHNVKIFERVPGYQINGTGTIELPLLSNQGRKFTYRQNSVNGAFVLPYSTDRSGSGVRATGPYTLMQTGQTYEVTEEQVHPGS
jgi:dolichyl-diphosphooligosaccharide--protein glycosyltransferase